MEYANGGELFNYIVKNDYLSEEESSYFFIQIIKSIEFIHSHKICHRDIKPENLLLTGNKKKILKLIDFGLSNEYQKLLSTPCGSPCYAAPEMIKGFKYNGLLIDIWASGIILFAMIFGFLPFDDKDNDKLFAKILECKIVFPENKNVSKKCLDLIVKILNPNPLKRIQIQEIYKHEFCKFGLKKYDEIININNINNNNNPDEIIIDFMENKLKYENVKNNLLNNKHNNITTTFKLFKKQFIEGRFKFNEVVINKSPKIELNSKFINFNNNIIKRNNNNINVNNKINLTGDEIIYNKKFSTEIEDKIKHSNPIENGNIIIINNNMYSNKLKNLYENYEKLYHKNYNKKNLKNLIRKIETSISVDKQEKKNIKNNINKTPIKKKLITSIFNNNNNLDIMNTTSSKQTKNSVNSNNINKKNFFPQKNNKYFFLNKNYFNKRDLSADNNNNKYLNNNYINNKNLSTERSINTAYSNNTNKTISNNNNNYSPNLKKIIKKKLNVFEIKKTHTKNYKSPISNYLTYNNNNNNIINNNNNIINNNNNIINNNNNIIINKNNINNLNYLPINKRTKKNIYSNNINTNTHVKNLETLNFFNKKNLLIIQKPIKNFTMTSTELSLYEIQNLLNKFSSEKKLNIKQEKTNKYILINNLNKFGFDINTEEGGNIIKLFHIEGDEKTTKNYIKELYNLITG